MLRWSALLFLAATAALVIAQDSDVVELDADNFDDTIGDMPIVLVEFYAPW